MALIRRPTCTTCWRESPLTRSIVSTSCCPGIGVRAADDAHAPKRGALRRKPSLDQTSELINLPINEQTSRARDPNSRRGSPDAYDTETIRKRLPEAREAWRKVVDRTLLGRLAN